MSRFAKLDWDDLRVVLEVARQGSIYAAAKVLKVDHSTVTRRIAHVEFILERQLFDRSNRGITPRAETESLIEHLRSMEMHATAAQEELESKVSSQARTIRVATMEGLASTYLARKIYDIAPSDASVRIELFSNPHIVNLLKKETDIFLSFFNPMIPGLISEQIGEVTVFLYASERYKSLHGLPSSRDELHTHRYVGYIPEMVSIDSVRWLDEMVPNANLVFCSNSVIAQRNAAISGSGLAVLPTFVGEESNKLFRVLPHELSARRPVWMSVGRDQHVIKAINQTAKAIARTFKEDKSFLVGDSDWSDNPR